MNMHGYVSCGLWSVDGGFLNLLQKLWAHEETVRIGFWIESVQSHSRDHLHKSFLSFSLFSINLHSLWSLRTSQKNDFLRLQYTAINELQLEVELLHN